MAVAGVEAKPRFEPVLTTIGVKSSLKLLKASVKLYSCKDLMTVYICLGTGYKGHPGQLSEPLKAETRNTRRPSKAALTSGACST